MEKEGSKPAPVRSQYVAPTEYAHPPMPMTNPNRPIRFPSNFPATFPKEKFQQILDAMASTSEFGRRQLWGVPEYNQGNFVGNPLLRTGPGRIFGGTGDLWRAHPGWKARFRDMWPGFGLGVALFAGYCALDFVYTTVTAGKKKDKHH